MKKRKIAFCLRDMQNGGVESCLIRVLDALRHNTDLEIIFISYTNISESRYAQWFAAHPEIKTYVLYPSRWLGTRLARFFLWRLIQHFMRDVYRWVRRATMNTRQFADVDLFIDYYEFGFARELRKFSAPRITWWHSSIDKFNSGRWARFLAQYDKMVVLTDDFKAQVCTENPSYADKFVRIYNPVDIAGIRAKATDVPDNIPGKYFVTVTRLSRDKDVETTLRGFNEFWIGAGRPDVYLIIVGDGADAARVKKIASDLDASEKILFVGAKNNPFGYMAGAIANILSSYSEGLGMVLIEAAAVGTLNISSNCKNGPREILLDGDGGMLFEPGNVSELAAAMMLAYKNRVRAKKMVAAASDELSRFGAEKIADKVVDLINEISEH